MSAKTIYGRRLTRATTPGGFTPTKVRHKFGGYSSPEQHREIKAAADRVLTSTTRAPLVRSR